MPYLRDEIDAAARNTGQTDETFRSLAGDERAQVLDTIGRRFVSDLNRTWWWEVFRCRSLSVSFTGIPSLGWISRLFASPETTPVWFIAGVDEGEPTLVYDTTVATAERILADCYGFEYYMLARDYTWLACENHHNACFAVGFRFMRRLRVYAREHSDHIFSQYTTPRRATGLGTS